MTKASKTKVMAKMKAALAEEGKAKPSPEGMPLTPATGEPQSTDKAQAVQAYVRELLDGKVKAPNRYVKDMVDQVRRAEQQLGQLAPRIEQLQTALQQAQQRRTALSAISQQTGLTLYNWREDGEKPDKRGD